jgi:hypothetical protein
MTEYKVEKVAYTTPVKELEKRLNGLAKEGWDLAGIDPRPGGRGTIYVFRREAKDDKKAVQGFAQLARSPKTENL